MGILRDAAVKIAKDTFVLFGTSAIIAAKINMIEKRKKNLKKRRRRSIKDLN